MIKIKKELFLKMLEYLKNYKDTGDQRGDRWQSTGLEKVIAEAKKTLENA